MFALPFALSALLLAVKDGWPTLSTVGWVLLAMVSGRTFAMALNRLADRVYDAANPRTQQRELVTGLVQPWEAWLLVLVSLAGLVWAVWHLPPLCWQLLPLAVLILAGYSYTKRFTSLCHLVLGLALGSSAIGGWLAHTGHWDGGLPVLFGLAVLLWVSGFDVIYACQDNEFDRAQGLYSLPARLGNATALRLSRAFHVGSVLVLVAFAVAYSLAKGFVGWGFVAATVLMGAMLWREHQLVRADDLTRVNTAFFTLNGIISLSILAGVLLDKFFFPL